MLVVSRRLGFAATGTEVVTSPEEAVSRAAAAGESEAFVAGGGEIYRALLGRADRVYLTRVGETFPGDAFFPPLAPAQWQLSSREERPPDEKNPYPLAFEVYDRRGPGGGDGGAPPGLKPPAGSKT
jgi:dihydrofolate reductase